MPDFYRAGQYLFHKSGKGHVSYLLGTASRDASPWFFPVLLGVKLPPAFLILVAIGSILAIQTGVRAPADRSGEPAMVLAAAAGILLVGVIGGISNGLRQVLAMIPLLGVIAGWGAARLLAYGSRKRFWWPAGVIVLFLWMSVSSIAAQPHYLAWFNSLAGDHPERIAVGSDLDWGQDLASLGAVLREAGVEHVWLRYNGSIGTPIERFGLPDFTVLEPYQVVDGWIAISVSHLKKGDATAPYDQYAWLASKEPVLSAGKSIWIYHLE
jgi:hypothetical protein